jgi:hypothetical protein
MLDLGIWVHGNQVLVADFLEKIVKKWKRIAVFVFQRHGTIKGATAPLNLVEPWPI